MKVFKHTFIVVLAGLVLLACEKEELNLDSTTVKAKMEKSDEVKMVPFKAKLSSFPTGEDVIPCYIPNVPNDPNGDYPEAFINNAVDGNATHLGNLDWNQSPLIVVDCTLNPLEQTITTTLHMTFMNKKGDGLLFHGPATLSIEGPSWGSFEIVEGYGKFEGALGEIETEGFFDINTGRTVFSAKGMVTQPNH